MEKLKKLREQSGAGITDCKKALDEAQGDINLAIEILRKKGISKAAKRSDRTANEGTIKFVISDDKTKGYMMELNSETDFVAKNEKFQVFADNVLNLAKEKDIKDLDSLLSSPFEESSVKESLESLSGIIGEKLEIGNFTVLEGQTVAAYLHLGGKLGILVALDTEGKEEMANNIAMHIAASNPQYLSPEEVPAEEIEKEKEIYKEQLEKEGKPAEIIEKIISGKINKYFEEICLVKQEYIKDEKQKIEQFLGDVKVIKFVKFSLS